MKERVDVFFDNSPVFRLLPEADKKGLTPVAWFDSDKPSEVVGHGDRIIYTGVLL